VTVPLLFTSVLGPELLFLACFPSSFVAYMCHCTPCKRHSGSEQT